MITQEQYEGTCLYCGQKAMVEAISQDTADIVASKRCNCDNILKRKANLEYLIDDQCGEYGRNYGMDPLKSEQLEFIKQVGEAVLEDRAEACSIKTGDSIVTIKKVKQGARVTRRRTQTIQAEV